jgi:hypothetical protein
MNTSVEITLIITLENLRKSLSIGKVILMQKRPSSAYYKLCRTPMRAYRDSLEFILATNVEITLIDAYKKNDQ